jgi:hypothetical protein
LGKYRILRGRLSPVPVDAVLEVEDCEVPDVLGQRFVEKDGLRDTSLLGLPVPPQDRATTCLEGREEVLVGVPSRELLASRLSLGVVGGRLGSLQGAHKLLETQRSRLAGHLNSEIHRRWDPRE